MLCAASDWPLHDISEEYLYSAHMLQHMMLTYFLPPLVLLATPEWLLRVLDRQRPRATGCWRGCASRSSPASRSTPS